MKRWIVDIPIAAALSLLLATACTTQQRVQTETALAKALISDQQSMAIGEQVHGELEKQNVRYLQDPEVVSYVEGISNRIFKYARQDRPEIDYHVHVIDDPNTVNAFATPGGHLYVYTGLLLAADNDSEVAGVMAHESGHIAGRHIERALVNAYGLQALSTLALGKDPGMLKQLGATIAGTGLLRAHTRSEETEADEYGARYASAAGYDPQGLITFFQKLEKKSGSSPRALQWLQTHPTNEQRISHLEDYIKDHDLEVASRRDSGQLDEIQRRLRRDSDRAAR